jgi:hypothetical protein
MRLVSWSAEGLARESCTAGGVGAMPLARATE